jgi:hypothetical protein
MRRVFLLIAAASLPLVSACGGGGTGQAPDDGQTQPIAPPTPTPTPTPSPTPAPTPTPTPTPPAQGGLLAGVEPAITYSRPDATCPAKDVGSNFSLPTVLAAEPGQSVESQCFEVAGLTGPAEISVLRGSYSINGVAVAQGSTRTPIRNGDQIRLTMSASTTQNAERWEDIYIDRAGGRTTRQWIVQTRNSSRAPRTWQVGPGRTHTSLDAVAPFLEEGDVIELDSGVYGPVRFTRAGSADRPIIIRGVGATRPVIRGTSSDSYRTTVHFSGAHHYLLENVEIDGGGGDRATSENRACVRTMANVVVLRNVYIHDCARNGILGSDLYSGTVVLDRVEIARAGAPATTTENTAHAVYIATDRDRHPGSVLRVMNSYIHDYEGGGIKSRSERNEIYFNWIETKAQRPRAANETQDPVLYTVEMYGYEEYDSEPRIDSDIVGNVLVHRNVYGLRLGGDGTGASRGRVRLVNNSVVVTDQFGSNTPVIRLFHALESLFLQNNLFVRAGVTTQAPLRLFRDDLAGSTSPGYGWVAGTPKVSGAGNWLPTGTDIRLYSGSPTGSSPAAALNGTQSGTANPGLAAIGAIDTLDVTPSGPLIGAGVPLTTALPADYAIASPLGSMPFRAYARRPTSGSRLDPERMSTQTSPNIGARQ